MFPRLMTGNTQSTRRSNDNGTTIEWDCMHLLCRSCFIHGSNIWLMNSQLNAKLSNAKLIVMNYTGPDFQLHLMIEWCLLCQCGWLNIHG